MLLREKVRQSKRCYKAAYPEASHKCMMHDEACTFLVTPIYTIYSRCRRRAFKWEWASLCLMNFNKGLSSRHRRLHPLHPNPLLRKCTPYIRTCKLLTLLFRCIARSNTMYKNEHKNQFRIKIYKMSVMRK